MKQPARIALTIALPIAAAAIAPRTAHAELFEFVSMNRDIEATCDMGFELSESESVDSNEEPEGAEPWVSGVVAEWFAGTAEAIGVADQDSYAQDGEESAVIHAQGFASGSARTGTTEDEYVDGAKADGNSGFRIAFRVTEEASYTIAGSIWSSGEDRDPSDEGWWIAGSRAQAETIGFGSDELNLDVVGDQVEFGWSGTLQPGQTYRIEFQVDGFARAEYDHDTGTSYSTYGGAGFEVDMSLSSSQTPIETLSFSQLKDLFRD